MHVQINYIVVTWTESVQNLYHFYIYGKLVPEAI